MNTASRPDEASALAKIRRTYPDLDRWGTSLGTSWRPHPGSELEADDQDWPAWPITQLAWGSLGAARDHLLAVRVTLEAGQLFAFATDTLLRTATVGAASAVWLLAPDDPAVRRARSRTLALENYMKHLQFLDDLRSHAPTPHEGTDTVHQHVTERLVEIRALRAKFGEKATLNLTDVIQSSTSVAHGTEYAIAARALWRSGSGAAHGLPWSILGRSGTTSGTVEGSDGLVEQQAGGSVRGMLQPYMLAYGLALTGWRLLAQRGGPPG